MQIRDDGNLEEKGRWGSASQEPQKWRYILEAQQSETITAVTERCLGFRDKR